jgi:1,2-phenylacetyl-CoA epoxidase catalytic subunit
MGTSDIKPMTLSNITAVYGNGTTGQIECLTVAYINAVRNWHSSQLQMFKDDMESTAALLINKYGVSPEGLDEIDQRYAQRYS